MFSVTALYFPFYFNVKFCTTSLLEAVFYQTGCCLLTLFGGRVKLLNFRCCFFIFETPTGEPGSDSGEYTNQAHSGKYKISPGFEKFSSLSQGTQQVRLFTESQRDIKRVKQKLKFVWCLLYVTCIRLTLWCSIVFVWIE